MVELAWFLSDPGSPPWQPHMCLPSFLLLYWVVTEPPYFTHHLASEILPQQHTSALRRCCPMHCLPASVQNNFGSVCLLQQGQLFHVHDLRLRSATSLDLTKDPFISAISLVYAESSRHIYRILYLFPSQQEDKESGR